MLTYLTVNVAFLQSNRMFQIRLGTPPLRLYVSQRRGGGMVCGVCLDTEDAKCCSWVMRMIDLRASHCIMEQSKLNAVTRNTMTLCGITDYIISYIIIGPIACHKVDFKVIWLSAAPLATGVPSNRKCEKEDCISLFKVVNSRWQVCLLGNRAHIHIRRADVARTRSSNCISSCAVI